MHECKKKMSDEERVRNSGQHRARNSRYSQQRYSQQRGAIALVASTAAAAPTTRWVLDTGASRHMTSNKSILLNSRPVTEDITITFGNGGTGRATAVGEVLLHTSDATFLLKDVLYIPEALENLISVRHAAKRGLEFNFRANSCEISLAGTRLAVASSTGDSIYYLTGRSESSTAESNSALVSRPKETARLWHERFGHLGYYNLAKLPSMVTGIHTTADEFKKAASEDDGFCEQCVLGKQHRSPFQPSESATTRPLALVHTDLCGPLPVTSMGGSNYFVTLLDDYSKLSIVRPLGHKSDTAAVVKDTLKLLENQSGYRVQRLRCDNGTEYINNDLKTFCTDNGIKLETTVRYTPEQNGAAERLNRTLMDKVRPMLAATSLPKYLWAEAVVTANYVRNRSPVAGMHKTPYELFFGTKPDVSNLRTFGVRAYALIPKQLRNKLENTSEPGHFIGYPPGTKGYRILLDDGRVIISRDVTFVESSGTTSPLAPEADSIYSSDEEDEEGVPVEVRPVAGETVGGGPSHPPAPPGVSTRQVPTLGSSASNKRSKQGATDIPTSVQRDESYTITGHKRSLAGSAHMAVINEPTTLEEALASEQAELWQHALNEEMASLDRKSTRLNSSHSSVSRMPSSA